MRMQESCLGIGLISWACLLIALPQADLAWPELTHLIAILPSADNPVLVYALCAFCTGVVQILGAMGHYPALRRASAIAAFTIWTFVAGGMVTHLMLAPSMAAYVTLAILNMKTASGGSTDHA